MSTDISDKKNIKNNENGLAVLVALGLTFLLLGLAVAFITTSIVEKKATGNYQDMAMARMAADSALSRALAIMSTKGMNESLVDISSVDKNDSDGNSPEELSELRDQIDTTINSKTYSLSENNSPIIKNYPPDTEWIYISTNNQANNKYIARMAFVVIPDIGRLDPSAAVDSGGIYNDLAATEGNVGIGIDKKEITMIDSNGKEIIGRPGKNINEIFLRTIDPNWEIYWEKISASNASPTGNLAKGTRWEDDGELISKGMNLSISSVEADTVRKLFSTDAPAIPEAYWIDNDKSGIKTPNELSHRFNLDRSKEYWDAITLSQIINASPIPISNNINFSSSNYIPWLANWKNIGDMPDETSARNQIIANLIDYNDSNDTATTDYNGTNIPSYFGLEKVPYINEVNIKISTTMTSNASSNSENVNSGGISDKTKSNKGKAKGNTPSIDNTWYYSISIPSAEIELVNIYPNINISSIAKLTVSISYRINSNNEMLGTTSLIGEQTSTYTFTNIGYQTKAVFYQNPPTISGTTINNYIGDDLTIDAKINDLTISLLDSSDPSKYHDYSLIRHNNESWTHLGSVQSGITKDFYLDYETRDPRQNFIPSNWTETLSANTSNMTKNAKNSIFPSSFTGTDTDPELADEPWNISTAYIRNAPMKSPWELGFIHRAKAFQTINLKKYNNIERNYVDAGGNAYSEGDANILDQIKMTNESSEYGKININSDIDAVLWPLFAKIRVGSSQDTPGELTANEITVPYAKDIAKTIQVASSTPFSTRSSILSNPSVSNKLISILGNIQNRDSAQEEIIGKFINISDASVGNIFYVIAVGQSFRDLGGVKRTKTGTKSSSEYQEYNKGIDEVLATVKIYAIVKRNPITNKFEILREQYVND